MMSFEQIRPCVRDLARRSSEEIVAFKATMYINIGDSCWRSTGGCERATQCSKSICCSCEKNGNNHQTFTTKSVFVLLATRGHNILYSDWWGRYSIDLYIALNFSCAVHKAHVIFVP